MKSFIQKRSFAAVFVVPLIALPAFVTGCSDSDDEEQTEEEDTPTEESPECAAIVSVCHHVDALSDLAKTCHDVAHDNVTDECLSRQDECIDHCESLEGAGGAGGHSQR